MKEILVTGSDIDDPYLDRLKRAGFNVSNPTEHLSEAELIDHLKGKHGYLLGGLERATESAVSSAETLELIAFLGVGYESFVAADTATQHGIAITNTPGAMVTSVAELTLGLLLGLRRRITFLNEQIKRGDKVEPTKASDLQGQVVGVIGLGAIGTRVAEMLHVGFGMDIVYCSRTRKEHVEEKLHARWLSRDEVLEMSDVVTLHVPTTSDTIGMIGSRELTRMKGDAVLINTARAEIVDPDALFTALSSGEIAGAAFDGYYTEPLPPPAADPHKLLTLADNLFLITPHIASLTDSSWNRMTEMSLASIENFFATGTDERIVNPDYLSHLRH